MCHQVVASLRTKNPQYPSGKLVPEFSYFQNKHVLPCVQIEPPEFQFVLIISHPVVGHPLKESGSVLFASSLQAFTDIAKLFLLRWKNWYFLLSSLMRFLSAQFFSLWKAAQTSNLSTTPLNFVLSVNLISVHSVMFPMSLIKILKRISLSIDHRGTLLVMASN